MIKKILFLAVLVLLGARMVQAGFWGADVTPVDLKCEALQNPLGIDQLKPRLSWRLETRKGKPERGIKQTAYRILVASEEKLLAENKADLWDSGKVASDQSVLVEYQGKAPESRMQCFWKVKIWTTEGRATSAPAKWTMGLLKKEDWSAKWISASRWFMEPARRPPGFIALRSPSWAMVELGKKTRIDSVKLYPHAQADFPVRFRIEASNDMDFDASEVVADCSGEDFNIGDRKVVEFPGNGITASYVRLLVLACPQGRVDSVVRQMEIVSEGRNVALMRPTLESGCRWESGHAFFMVDGMPSANDGEKCPEDACPAQTAPLLRKPFALAQPVTRATLYYAAHGMVDVTINGKPIDDSVLGPRFSDYGKSIYYRVLDVTPLVGRGENVIGAVLGNGFFSPPSRGFGQRHNGRGQPRLWLQIEIELADGSHRTIVSDESWRWARSEIVSNDMWDGYVEDRRIAKPGWDRPGYVEDAWRLVGVVDSLGGEMRSAQGPQARILGKLMPDRVEGNTAYFEKLSAGWPRLVVRNGKAGQTISLRGDSSIPCQFTLAVDGPAVLEPRFVWGSGPLKLTVTGLNEPLTRENISIQQVGADFVPAGSFRCSNPWFNTLNEVVLRTYSNYCLDYPLDPMREKQGWTEDGQNFFNTAAYLADVNRYYQSWWRDMADNQRPNGLTGAIMPLMGQLVNDWNCPWWSGVIVWLPWEHYLYYGDRRFLEEAYEPMRRYVDYLGLAASRGAGTRALDYPDPHYFLNQNAAKERLIIWSGANDWQHPDGDINFYAHTETGPLVNMAAWYHFASVISKTAALLGKKEDAEKYAAIAGDVAKRTNAKYLNASTGLYGKRTNDQTAQVLALGVGMVPPELREQTRKRLIDAIHARNDHHAVGFVALPYLLKILTELRETGLANRIVNQQDYPSWKTLMHHGVLAEGWNGGGAQMPSCGGAVGMWLYQSVLGIRPDPAGPGFKRFILAPQPDPATGLTQAEGWYESPYGRIVSSWKREGARLAMKVVVPPNTTATLFVPATDKNEVAESGKPLEKAKGVKFLRVDHGSVVLEVGSGSYEFSVKK